MHVHKTLGVLCLLGQVRWLVAQMNPTAQLVESTYSAVPLEAVLDAVLFSMSEVERHEGWLQEARVGEHTPETEEYGISSFTYRALKPFHPKRFNQVLDEFSTIEFFLEILGGPRLTVPTGLPVWPRPLSHCGTNCTVTGNKSW